MNYPTEITFAIPKGRLLKEAIKFLSRAGIVKEEIFSEQRKLIFKSNNFKFLLVKPMDVPTYVYYGTADVGIA